MPRFRATRPRPSWVAAILEYQGRLLSFAVNKSFECVVKLPWLPWLGFQLLRFSKTLFHNSLPPFTCGNVPVLPFEFHVLRRSVLRKLNGVFLVFPLVPYRLFPSWSHEGYVLFHTGIFFDTGVFVHCAFKEGIAIIVLIVHISKYVSHSPRRFLNIAAELIEISVSHFPAGK